MIDRVRVGVIGVGRMGANHVRVYSMLRAAEIVGLFDVDRGSAANVSAAYGVTACEDLRDLLSRVEAVSIAVPTPLHVQVAAECIERGIHVLVEKPIAGSVAEAEELIRLAQREGVVLQVGHVERFNPAVQEAARIVSGDRVISLVARRLSPPTVHISDDVVVDLMIHDIDIALSLSRSPVITVRAMGATDGEGDLNIAIAHLRSADGLLVDLMASKVTQHRVRELEVTTERSFVTVNYRTRDVSIYRNASVSAVGFAGYQQEATIERPLVPLGEPLYFELDHFLACVHGSPPVMQARESLDALELALRIRELARASID